MTTPVPPPPGPVPWARLDEATATAADAQETLRHAQLAFVQDAFFEGAPLLPVKVVRHVPFYEFHAPYPLRYGPCGSHIFVCVVEAPYTQPPVYELNAPAFICAVKATRDGVEIHVRANSGFVDAVKAAGLEARLVEMLQTRLDAEEAALQELRKSAQARVDTEVKIQRAALRRQEDAAIEARRLLQQAAGLDVIASVLD